MDEMREIVTREQVEHWFLFLALLAPVIGAALGAAAGALKGKVVAGGAKGFLIGLIGPVNLLLWKVYNGITDRLGLDTVKNLVVNLALFVGLGIGAGLVMGIIYRRSNPPESASDSAGPFDRGTPRGPGRRGHSFPVGAGAGPRSGKAGSAASPGDSDLPPRDP